MTNWFKIDLWKRVLAALVLGLGTGLALRYGMGADASGPFAIRWIGWLGDIFLRMIKMLIVPLVFFTLVSGVVAMGDPKKLGSLGGRAMGMYFGTTAIAVSLGLFAGAIIRPGASLSSKMLSGVDTSAVTAQKTKAQAAGGFVERLLEIVPTNPFEALATGNILQVIFFSILFGIGILLARDLGKPAAKFFDSAAEAIMKVTVIVMEVAPFGVFALMAVVMADKGLGTVSYTHLTLPTIYSV